MGNMWKKLIEIMLHKPQNLTFNVHKYHMVHSLTNLKFWLVFFLGGLCLFEINCNYVSGQ